MAKATPVDRLDPGDHACLTYSDPEERLDIPAAFVADGLDRGENVACYTNVIRIKDLSDELHQRTGAGTERR